MRNRKNIQSYNVKIDLQMLIKIFDFPVDIFVDKDRHTYEESCNKFSNVRFKNINFYEFLTQNNLHIPVIFKYFVKI